MIQPNEIRLNNWFIGYDGKPFRWEIGHFKMVHDGLDIDEIIREPIKLTEDVLLKCGAKLKQSDNNWKYYEIDGFLFDFKIDEQKVWFSAFDRDGMQMSNDFDIEIKYLHQLQNIFYSLVGSELQINL